jgi:prepilin peptidase CpaA
MTLVSAARLALLICAGILYAEVVRQDLTRRTIPNRISLILVLLGFLRWGFAVDLDSVLWSLIASLMALAIGMVLFIRGWVGGGDVKLVSATIFVVGYRDSAAFLFWTAILGGVVSLLVVLWMGFRRLRFGRQIRAGVGGESISGLAPATVPYGVAIAGAAMCVLLTQ